jgi:hypothetical protein
MSRYAATRSGKLNRWRTAKPTFPERKPEYPRSFEELKSERRSTHDVRQSFTPGARFALSYFVRLDISPWSSGQRRSFGERAGRYGMDQRLSKRDHVGRYLLHQGPTDAWIPSISVPLKALEGHQEFCLARAPMFTILPNRDLRSPLAEQVWRGGVVESWSAGVVECWKILMENHLYLVVITLEGNLSQWMHQLRTAYTAYLIRWHLSS